MSPDAEAWFRARIKNPRTLARVLKANQGLQEGEMLCGSYRLGARWKWRKLTCALIGKGEAIRLYGRRAWEMLPHGLIHRDGRRQAAPINTLADLARVPAGREAKARELLARQYVGRRYASDFLGAQRRVLSEADLIAWAELMRP